MTENDLQKRLEKLGSELVSDIEAWEKRTRGDRAKALDELSHSLGGALGEVVHTIAAEAEKAKAREDERKARRREEKEARRRERDARNPPSIAVGVVFLTAAVLCAVMGVMNPGLWWMVFVALGLGLSGAGQLASAARRRRDARPAAPLASDVTHEVDALCDQLLVDLEASPDAVKAFISEPKKTVATMRATLKALDVRRQQLLSEDAVGRLARLERQRAEVETKRAAATDPEALARMNEALGSMAGQRQALEQLKTATERVDGEYTSLLVHLQELRTRVAVAKSTSTQVQLEGLKVSVQRLNDELGAISEAMEAVRRGDVSAVVETTGADPRRERERVRE
ncbi:MAG: hypothetical protein SFW67_16820 [Myxococcaceae bacterium]|nr:hypothetical protein [Myxococcaceae bacterium]